MSRRGRSSRRSIIRRKALAHFEAQMNRAIRGSGRESSWRADPILNAALNLDKTERVADFNALIGQMLQQKER